MCSLVVFFSLGDEGGWSEGRGRNEDGREEMRGGEKGRKAGKGRKRKEEMRGGEEGVKGGEDKGGTRVEGIEDWHWGGGRGGMVSLEGEWMGE